MPRAMMSPLFEKIFSDRGSEGIAARKAIMSHCVGHKDVVFTYQGNQYRLLTDESRAKEAAEEGRMNILPQYPVPSYLMVCIGNLIYWIFFGYTITPAPEITPFNYWKVKKEREFLSDETGAKPNPD